MKFENLEQFINASMINKAKWLREAEVDDLATVMAKHQDFSKVVMETVGEEGRKALNEAKLFDYDKSLLKLIEIEFEASKHEIKEFPNS